MRRKLEEWGISEVREGSILGKREWLIIWNVNLRFDKVRIENWLLVFREIEFLVILISSVLVK